MLFETVSAAVKILEGLKMRSMEEIEGEPTLLGGVCGIFTWRCKAA